MPPSFPVRPLRRLTMIITAATAVGGLSGVAAVPAEAATDAGLVRKLNTVLSDGRAVRAKTGAVVLDAESGQQLYSRYGTRAVMPASNAKIVTAAAAMHTLGPNRRFATEVIRRADVVDGVLQGRLYLKGYGDPTTRQSDFAKLAAAVKAAGITKIDGSLVVDSSYFDHQRYNPGWKTSYAADYYAAEVSALTVAPNADLDSGTMIINYSPGRSGRPASISTTPAAAKSYVKIVNRTTTSSRGTSTTFAAHRNHGSNTVTLTGRVPSGRSTGHWQITVDKPELYAGAVFRAELAKLKITVGAKTVIQSTPGDLRHVVGRDTSVTLSELLVPFLKLSNNLHAETLTKVMGRAAGRPGNWTDGLAVTTAYLKGLGVPMAGISLTDGSGVARADRLTPLALATTLQKVQAEDWYPSFYNALPVAGDTRRMVGGTLRYRMNGTKAAKNAHAKTGSLTGVTALSGYVTGDDGRTYTFSLVSNYSGSTPRPVENSFVVALANWDG